MTRAEYLSRLTFVLAAVVFASAIALFVIGLVGIALLIAGLISWLHPVDVASAWARTLAGIGLIGGSAGLAALDSLALRRMARPLDDSGRRRYRIPVVSHRPKLIAAIGILIALICLPFAAAIHAAFHGSWFGWGGS